MNSVIQLPTSAAPPAASPMHFYARPIAARCCSRGRSYAALRSTDLHWPRTDNCRSNCSVNLAHGTNRVSVWRDIALPPSNEAQDSESRHPDPHSGS